MCAIQSSAYHTNCILSPPPPLNPPLPTCAVGLSRVRSEAHHLQVRELWSHVVFPGNHQWGRTQIDFVQHQDHLLLELSCDVVVQGWGELQDLGVDMSIALSISGCTVLDFFLMHSNSRSCAAFNAKVILESLNRGHESMKYIWHVWS